MTPFKLVQKTCTKRLIEEIFRQKYSLNKFNASQKIIIAVKKIQFGTLDSELGPSTINSLIFFSKSWKILASVLTIRR